MKGCGILLNPLPVWIKRNIHHTIILHTNQFIFRKNIKHQGRKSQRQIKDTSQIKRRLKKIFKACQMPQGTLDEQRNLFCHKRGQLVEFELGV